MTASKRIETGGIMEFISCQKDAIAGESRFVHLKSHKNVSISHKIYDLISEFFSFSTLFFPFSTFFRILSNLSRWEIHKTFPSVHTIEWSWEANGNPEVFNSCSSWIRRFFLWNLRAWNKNNIDLSSCFYLIETKTVKLFFQVGFSDLC